LYKSAAVALTFTSLIFVIIAMSTFSTCRNAIEDDFKKDTNKTVKYGPGFNSMGLNAMICFVLWFAHLILPATPSSQALGHDDVSYVPAPDV
jgi:hypothetical protein